MGVLKEGTNIGEFIDGMFNHPISVIEGLLNLSLDFPFVPFGKRMTPIRKCDAFIYGLIERRLANLHDVGDIFSLFLSVENENSNKRTRNQVRNASLCLTP